MAGLAGAAELDWRRFISVPIAMLVLMAPVFLVATPSKGANEDSAIRSVMAINLAESQYEITYPAKGYSCSLAALGGDPHAGPPTAANAKILRQNLASGVEGGYRFEIVSCTKHLVRGIERVTGYRIIARPSRPGHTGNRTFCSDESGQIKFDPTGRTNCTESIP